MEEENLECSSDGRAKNCHRPPANRNRGVNHIKVGKREDKKSFDILIAKIIIPDDILIKMIECYKRVKTWNAVSVEFKNKYSKDIIVSSVVEFLGKIKYQKLVKFVSKNRSRKQCPHIKGRRTPKKRVKEKKGQFMDDIYKENNDKYPNLLDSRLVNIFKNFRRYTKDKGKEKSPSIGTRYFRPDFKNWVKEYYKNYDLILEKAEKIIVEKELLNFVIDLIKETTLSQLKIVLAIDNLGLMISYDTIARIGREQVFNNEKDYNNRFPKGNIIRKWRFLDWDEVGIPRTYQGAVKNASDYIENNILTNENKKKFGKIAPSIPQIRKIDSEFTGAFVNRGISIYDINQELNLESKIVLNRWSFLDWGEEGTPRTYQEAAKNASSYLLNNILTEDYNYKDHKRETIKKSGHNDFLRAIQDRHIRYNDVLKSIGLDIYRNQFKWENLDWGEVGIPRTYQDAVKNASNYLLNNILTEDYKLEYSIKDGFAPSISLLEMTNNDFASAVGYRRLSYIDIRRTAKLKRSPLYKSGLNKTPITANLGLIKNLNLLNHLKFIKKQGQFPDYILDNWNKFPRISDFRRTLTNVPHTDKYNFIKSLIKEKKIRVVYYKPTKQSKNKNSIYNLLELTQDKNYVKNDFINPQIKRRYAHKSAGHNPVLSFIIKDSRSSVGTEIPIWKKYRKIYLTGHIDLIQINRSYVDIIDYKPNETPILLSDVVYTSFINSIPQVGFYGLITKRNFKIKKLRCITFNKVGAWIYDPDVLLVKIRDFLLAHERPCLWKDYLY